MAISVGYFLKEAATSFKRNWVMSLGAVITIYLSLLIVGISMSSGVIINSIMQSVEQKVAIRVFLADGAADADVEALTATIRADERVKSITYISKEQALEDFKEQMKDSPELLEQLEVNPLPASLDVDLDDPHDVQAVIDKIKADPLFLKVCDRPDDPDRSIKGGGDIVDRLFAVTRILRIAGIVFIIMLAGISLIFINNTIRLAIYSRRKEIGIMRLVGASNWFIRTPFLLEGVMQALTGAVVAIATLVIGQVYLLPKVTEAVRFLSLSLGLGDMVQIGLVLVGAAILIGLTGSGLALRRYLKV